MASKRIKEFKDLSKDELISKIRLTEQGLFESRMKHKTGQLEDSAILWRLRKDLACLKTMFSLQGKR